MQTLTQPAKQFYSELEAAIALGISVAMLHSVLDRHIFNQGTPRPERLQFMPVDLLMLSYWLEQSAVNVVSIEK